MSQLQVTGEAKIRDIQGPVVSNSGVISALDGDASQYVRGDGTLADFPTSTGGGSSVSYYLNTSVSQGTIGGVAYKQLGKVPIAGAGTDVTISANGYIASYITDANDPALLEVPAGNFNCEFYFSVNSNAHNPYVYAEVYKYDGTTFTLLGSSQSVPEYLTNGTTLSPYYFAIPVATSVLTITDRIAIRIYVNVDGRTVTLHTENNHLCQVVTTFSKGLTTLNSLTRQVQFFQTGTSGTDFNISSVTATHTFNIPDASASARGLITTGTQTIGGAKTYNNTAIFESSGGTGLQYGASISKGFTPFTFSNLAVSIYSDATTNNVIFRDNLSSAKLLFDNSTQTYTFPASSGTIALLERDQIFTGFNFFDYSINYKTGASLSNVSGYISQAYAKSGTGAGSTLSLKISDGNSVKAINLDFVGSPATYTYTFPDFSGTVALTSQLGSYLPLAGGIMTGSLLLNNNIPIQGQLFGTSSYATMMIMSPSNKILIDGVGLGVIFGSTIGQGSYTYNFPSASGTLALTSDIPSLTGYVPYTGATQSVNLGAFDLTVNGVKIGIGAGSLTSNTILGAGSLGLNTTGYQNTAVGNGAMYSNTTGYDNVAVGYGSLTLNTSGTYNTSVGSRSLFSNTTGNNNTAIGNLSLNLNTTGAQNSSLGAGSLQANTTGSNNTGIGNVALQANTTGDNNTAIGSFSSYINTTGANNTSVGASSLSANTTGQYNTAIGSASLYANTTGYQNTAIGYNSLGLNTTGYNNIAIGQGAGNAITTGSNNTIVGAYAGTTTMTNNIILADGAGNIKYRWDGTNNNLYGNVNFSSTIGNGTYTYTLPNATGTLALTSSLSSYLPLTGGTLTGGLYINPTNTEVVGLDITSNTTRFRSNNLEGFKRQLEITMGSGTLVQMVAKGFGANYVTDLAFYTSTSGGVNGSPAMYITGGNQIGLGTGLPAATLDVVGTGKFSGLLSVSNNGETLKLGTTASDNYIAFTNSSGTQIGDIGYDGRDTGGLSIWNNNASGSLVFGAGGSRRMTITSAGNVGIGTTSPTAIMQIQGAQSGVSGKNLTISYNSTYYAEYTEKSITAFNNELIFGTGAGGTEKMRITGAGLVGIGTMPLSGQKLIVNIASNQNIRFSSEGGQATISGVNGDASAFGMLNIDGNVVRIQSNNTGGNVCIGTATDFGYKLNLNGQPGANGYTLWTNWSDSRLKENVTDLEVTNVLDKICAIRPVTYNYNELSGFDEATRSRRISGFIAQELMEVFPDMVGTIKKDDKEYYDTNLSNLDLYLVKAIQEQQALITLLQEQINELKNK